MALYFGETTLPRNYHLIIYHVMMRFYYGNEI